MTAWCDRALVGVWSLPKSVAALSATSTSATWCGPPGSSKRSEISPHMAESWIAGGVIHHHAFNLAWDILSEQGLLTED